MSAFNLPPTFRHFLHTWHHIGEEEVAVTMAERGKQFVRPNHKHVLWPDAPFQFQWHFDGLVARQIATIDNLKKVFGVLRHSYAL